MSYPKPLSEKSLNRLYMQAGLSTETCAFLHSLFAACANLYGTIALRDVWSVYQELKSDVPRIHRRDLIAFSSIVRREVQPYWVYEIEELYTEEPHNDLDRHIVSKELIGAGYGKMFSFYALMDERDDRPYCVPDDFLSYAEPTASVEEKSLADFIGNLKSTAMECAPKQRKTYPNENRGKKLNEFSFLNLNERFNLDYYKKVPATYSALLAEYSGTEAEKIMRFHRRAENVGHLRTTDMIQNVLIELCEVGVRLTEKQQDTLMQLIVQYHNGSRLWCTCGWKPDELAAKFSGIGAFPGQEASSPEGMMDEKSEIEADVESLMSIIKKYKDNWDNERFVSGNHNQVLTYQNRARKNMLGYQKKIVESIGKKPHIVTQAGVKQAFASLEKEFKYYRLSLYTFSLSSLMEVMLSGNFKESYISGIRDELQQMSDAYRDLFEESSHYLEKLSNSAVDANVMKGIGTAGNAVGKFIGSIPLVKEGPVDEFLQDGGIHLKKSALDMEKDAVHRFASIGNPGTRMFTEKMDEMIQIYNRTELICFDDKKIYLLPKKLAV